MSKKRFTPVRILALVLLLTIAAFSTASAEAVPTDAIDGTWYGNMHFDAFNSVQRVKMTIPAECEAGEACGSLQNFPVQCTWELTFDGFDGEKYLYHFSNTLDGVCPAGSNGALTFQSDGTLFREHAGPGFTASGVLSQRPNAD